MAQWLDQYRRSARIGQGDGEDLLRTISAAHREVGGEVRGDEAKGDKAIGDRLRAMGYGGLYAATTVGTPTER